MVSKNIKLKGFTIVELLIVIVVIGILAAITIVSYSGISARATLSSNQSNANAVLKSAEAFRSDSNAGNGSYPATSTTSGTGTSSQYAYFNCTHTSSTCSSAANQSVKVPAGFALTGQATAAASSGATLPNSSAAANQSAILYVTMTAVSGVVPGFCVYYYDPVTNTSPVLRGGTATSSTAITSANNTTSANFVCA